ncbi:MAG: hypothetical protein GY832_30770 [Chloroflexi bacterium]|nr:hypothetical protein [Chloroflexota bacterium]
MNQETTQWQAENAKSMRKSSWSRRLDQINVEKAAQDVRVAASALRYDLNELKKSLPEVLDDQKRGPKPKEVNATVKQPKEEYPIVCSECGARSRRQVISSD